MSEQDNINKNNVDKSQEAAKAKNDVSNNIENKANDNSSQNNEKIANENKAVDKKTELAPQNNKAQESKAQESKSQESKNQESKNQASKTLSNTENNAPPAKNNSPAASKNKSSSGSSGKGLSFVALLASLAALGGSGYMYYQGQNDTTASQVGEITSQLENLNTNQSQMLSQQQFSNAGLAEANQQIESMVGQIASQEESIAAQVSEWQASIAVSTETANQSIREELETINAQLSESLKSIKQSKQLLVLDSANALVQGADNQINVFASVPSALKALQKAQALVASLDQAEIESNGITNISLASLTDVLNTDAQLLNNFLAAEKVDVPAELLSLVDQVDALTIYVPESETAIVEASSAEASAQITDESQNTEVAPKPWYLTMKDKVVNTVGTISSEIVEDLGSVISVEDVADKVNEPFKPEAEYFLRQNLIAQLENAQQAWLQKNDNAYLANMTTAKKWVAKYFEAGAYGAGAAETVAFAEMLEKLSTSTTAVTLPSINSSVEAFAAVDTKVAGHTSVLDSQVESAAVIDDTSEANVLPVTEIDTETETVEAVVDDAAVISEDVVTESADTTVPEMDTSNQLIETQQQDEVDTSPVAEVVEETATAVDEATSTVSDAVTEIKEELVDNVSEAANNVENDIISEQGETATEASAVEENNNTQ